MHILFLFLDGVGLGENDPQKNPSTRAEMPILTQLLDGRRMTKDYASYHNDRASLLGLDACLSVGGLPQSASGQAALLTGRNVPAEIGQHYGPKPNPEIAKILREDNIFIRLTKAGRKAALLNAYPPRYFYGIHSKRRIYSAIPLAVTAAGMPLFTKDDLYAGSALSADFTAQGWRERLGYADAPVLTTRQAGARMAELAMQVDFAMFEYWPSDYAGHGQDMGAACQLLETLDGVLEGLLEKWTLNDGLILIASDHGNMEDLSTRKHTANQAACLLVGAAETRRQFTEGLVDLTGIAPQILNLNLMGRSCAAA